MTHPTPITLTIAGSDSGGGAGIQADIKAISATGGYACSAITALTAQNTRGVTGIHPVPVAFIRQQLDTVFADLDIRAVKIGMLGDVDTIDAVADALRQHNPPLIVLDPVMVTSNGDMLLAQEAVDRLLQRLVPLADLITPNLPEAMTLLGLPGGGFPAAEEALDDIAQRLQALGARASLVKGGHQTGSNSTDVLAYSGGLQRYSTLRIHTPNTHGTGCTLSAAIASYLAQGEDIRNAVRRAKDYITAAIRAGDRLRVGGGRGPVDHFYHLREV